MSIQYFVGNKLVGLSSDTKPLTVIDGATFYETDTRKNFLKVSGVWEEIGGLGSWQAPVVTRSLASPPGDPAVGDRYIISDTAGAYISQYPPSQDATYVKATSAFWSGVTGYTYQPFYATDPAKLLTGPCGQWDYPTGWMATSASNQRFHIDLGSAKTIKRIYYENFHSSGEYTAYGAKDFTFWGTNDADAFANLTYSSDLNWTQIDGALQFDQHTASDVADPKYIIVTNTTAYRYYAVKIANCWSGDLIGLRRIELQISDTGSWGSHINDIAICTVGGVSSEWKFVPKTTGMLAWVSDESLFYKYNGSIWAQEIGSAGYSGYSGYSGISGYSGYSGVNGDSGYSGISGYSGYSGESGISGYSGESGISGYSGLNYPNDGTANPVNLISNGDFENWSAGTSVAPDGWTLIDTGTYVPQYPPAYNDTYVKATSSYTADFYPYFATNPANSVTGLVIQGNSWLVSPPSPQRFHIDLGSAKVIERIYYENMHQAGDLSDRGVKTFTFWGSNDADAFAELTYGVDTNWTEIVPSQYTFDQHVALDQADPKYITVTNTTAYRYYAFKFADNWGSLGFTGVRRIVLQSAGTNATVEKETSIVKLGTASAKVTRVGYDAYFFNNFHEAKGIEYWKGRKVTLSCWVYATEGDRACILLWDGSATVSNFHTGDSTWQLLSVSKIVDSGATFLGANCSVANGDTSAYFDGFMVTEGETIWAFADQPAGTSGYSGYSGISGYSGYSGMSLEIATGNINYYVNPDSGSNSNPGTTGEPFLTIQYAIDQLPKMLVQYTATIYLQSSLSYNEEPVISGFSGGIIVIRSVSNNPADILITLPIGYGLQATRSSTLAYLQAISLRCVNEDSQCIYADRNSSIVLDNVKLGDSANTSSIGVLCIRNSKVTIRDNVTNYDSEKVAYEYYTATGGIIIREKPAGTPASFGDSEYYPGVSHFVVDADPTTALVPGNGSVNPNNLVSNGDFEVWNSGDNVAPDYWTLYSTNANISKESGIVKMGAYSVKIEWVEADVYLVQNIHNEKGLEYWKGRTLTIGCWVWCNTADRACLTIYDGANTLSSYHTGDSTWQWLTITRTIDSGATFVEVDCNILGGAASAYFDGFMAVEGASQFAFSRKPTDVLVSGDRYNTTSLYPMSISATPKNFVVDAGLSLAVGQSVNITYDVNNSMTGVITAYDPANGNITVDVTYIVGSGGYSGWTISLAGVQGEGYPNDGSVNPNNIVFNGNFELWSAGPSALPDGWFRYDVGTPSLTVERESTIVKLGTYSCKLTREGGDATYIGTNDISGGIVYWQGRTVTLSCWVYATEVEKANIYIYDGINVYSSAWHSGNGTWELLSVTCTIDPSATLLSPNIWDSGAGTGASASCYFDGLMFTEGSSLFAFADKLASDSLIVDYFATSTIVGWAASPTGNIYIKKIGNMVFVNYYITGTSNSTSTSFTIPYTISGTSYSISFNTTGGQGLGICSAGNGTNTITFPGPAWGDVTWPDTGTKTIQGQIFFKCL